MLMMKWQVSLSLIGILLFCSAGLGASEEETPVQFETMTGQIEIGEGAEPWKPPVYSGQESALGWSPEAFAIPKGMEERVSFWVDIYSNYTTDQGLLHDSEHVHLVYEDVDLTDIMKNESLSDHQKSRLRSKRVKDAKAAIRDRLKRLAKVKDPKDLKGEDLRYWKLFERVNEKNKFIRASKDGRLRFQLGQRDRFIQGIYYSGRYLPDMEEIFRKQGLPIELTRLPFVESSFNIKAQSRVGASGIWQFMRYTARPYLRMNWAVDERNDPFAATEAAATYLRGNYKMLESWPLAVTGYNHGPYGVKKMVRRYKTNDIVELIEKRKGRFGFASANFYASFLAALEVEKKADKLFGKIFRLPPMNDKKIVLGKNISHKTLLEWFDNDEDKAKLFNPHIRSRIWQGRGIVRRKNFIRVPNQIYAQVVEKLKTLKSESGLMAGRTYRVARGDTLIHIAKRFGVQVKDIMQINEISNPRHIRAGQKLVIPKFD